MPGGATGSVLTGADVIELYPAEFQHNGTLVSGATTDTVMPRITLADAATQRVKWLLRIPPSWDAIAVQWVSINEGAGAGNVRWQFTHRQSNLAEGDVDGAVTTVSVAARAAGGQRDLKLETPSELALVLTPNGPFGEKPFVTCALSRLGADGTDTLAAGISVAVVICSRVDI